MSPPQNTHQSQTSLQLLRRGSPPTPPQNEHSTHTHIHTDNEYEECDMVERDCDCPLCLEEMDASDQRFKPCPCGYQICRFCYHRIREEINGRCPACRRIYTDDVVEFTPEPAPRLKRRAQTARQKASDHHPASLSGNGHVLPSRKHLLDLRVIQRNLVYVIGISARIAQESILKEPEFFGQYGRILKIVVNRRNLSGTGGGTATSNGGANSTSSTGGPSASAYVTFARSEDAARAISGIDGSVFDGRVIRATYGTTKYCSYFLRGLSCPNAGCMYLHEEGDGTDSFTKEDLSAGKMHLHSYLVDKAESAQLRQFGTLLPKIVVNTSSPDKKESPLAEASLFPDETLFFQRLTRWIPRDLDDIEPPPVSSFDPFSDAFAARTAFSLDCTNSIFDSPWVRPEDHQRHTNSNQHRPSSKPLPIGSPANTLNGKGFDPFGAVPKGSDSVSQFFNLFSNTTEALSDPSRRPKVESVPSLPFLKDPAIMHARISDHLLSSSAANAKFNQIAATSAAPTVQIPPVVAPVVYSTGSSAKKALSKASKTPPPPAPAAVAKASVPTKTRTAPPVAARSRSPLLAKVLSVSTTPVSVPLSGSINHPQPAFANKNLFALLQSPEEEEPPGSSEETPGSSEESPGSSEEIARSMSVSVPESALQETAAPCPNQDGRNQDGRNQDGRNQDERNQDGRNQDERNQDGRNQDGLNQDGRKKFSEELALKIKQLAAINPTTLSLEQLSGHIEELENAVNQSRQDVHELESQLCHLLSQQNPC